MQQEEMKNRARTKIQEVVDFMKERQLTVEAKQCIGKTGFVENIIVWNDNEKYPVETPTETPTETVAEAIPDQHA